VDHTHQSRLGGVARKGHAPPTKVLRARLLPPFTFPTTDLRLAALKTRKSPKVEARELTRRRLSGALAADFTALDSFLADLPSGGLGFSGKRRAGRLLVVCRAALILWVVW